MSWVEAQGIVVARLVIGGVVAQRLAVEGHRLVKLLGALHDDAHVMKHLGSATLVAFEARGRVIFLHGLLGLVLVQQGVAQVVVGNGVRIVILNGFLILNLRLGSILLQTFRHGVAHQTVATPHVVAVVLSRELQHGEARKEHHGYTNERRGRESSQGRGKTVECHQTIGGVPPND